MDMCPSVHTEFITVAYVNTTACLKYGKMIGSYVFCVNIVIYLVNFPELNRVCHISELLSTVLAQSCSCYGHAAYLLKPDLGLA